MSIKQSTALLFLFFGVSFSAYASLYTVYDSGLKACFKVGSTYNSSAVRNCSATTSDGYSVKKTVLFLLISSIAIITSTVSLMVGLGWQVLISFSHVPMMRY